MKRIAVYLRVVSDLNLIEVTELAKKSNNNINSKAMSIFDELIEEGKEIGKE